MTTVSAGPRIVDLTLTLHHGMRGVAFETACTLAEHGWNARTLHLYSHGGTHMDAPLHFGVTEETIDLIPRAHCMGPAWVVDLPGLAPRAMITVAHLGDGNVHFLAIFPRAMWATLSDPDGYAASVRSGRTWQELKAPG